MQGGLTNYYDKVPNKFYGYTKTNFIETGARVVPNATVRRGSLYRTKRRIDAKLCQYRRLCR